MTYAEAVAIRTSQLQGHAVPPHVLEEAIALIRCTPIGLAPRARGGKKSAAKLRRERAERANEALAAKLPQPRPADGVDIDAVHRRPAVSATEMRAAEKQAWARIGQGDT